MGNKAYTKDQVELLSSHPNFKKAKVITEKDQRHITTTVPSDDKGYDEWKKLLAKHQKKLSKNKSLLLPKKHTFTKQGMCAHTGNVQIDYDYFPYVLAEQIANRAQRQQRFRQADLWCLLHTLVGALNESHQLSQRVGDIRPENVFINYDGQIKIGSVFSYPNQHSNYKKAINLQPTFLAPEDVDKLALGATDNPQNQHSQLFSVGLTIIAAGILENPSKIYDFKTFAFDKGYASDIINKWKNAKHYSEVFRGLVANLVQFNPENRLNLAELSGWINKYELNIKSKEKFLITSVPAKIQKQVSDIRKFVKN